ncbi:MAG: hypothetical protein AB7V39_21910 [Nitrospiraceae bacterium]
MRTYLTITIILITPVNAFGDQLINIDLSKDIAPSYPINADQPFTIKLQNTAPGAYYVPSYTIENYEIGPLTSFPAEKPTPSLTPGLATTPQGCIDAKNSLDALLQPSLPETDVQAKLSDARQKLTVAESANCQDIGELKNQLSTAESKTARVLEGLPTNLPSGRLMRVDITRYNDSNKKDAKANWKFNLSTGKPGSWDVTFGFIFSPDRNENYFTKESGEQFIITRKTDNNGYEFTPAVMFNWIPNGKDAESNFGMTAGLGLNLDNPTILGGISWTYFRNISLSGGVIVKKQNRLDGRWSVGDDSGVQLSDDKLVEKIYDKSLYLGVTFRFEKSPF